MEKEVKIKLVGKYNGHSVKPTRVVDLALKLPYDELATYIQSVQMLNENVTLIVRLPDSKPVEVGTFMIGELKIASDGEGNLRLKSNMDSVNANVLNDMAIDDPFNVLLRAKIEIEEEDPEEDAEDWDD